MILVCVPLASIIYTLESWPWGVTLCRVTECFREISIGVSVFTLTALAADRYCAIVNPLRKLQVNHTLPTALNYSLTLMLDVSCLTRTSQTRPITVIVAVFIWLLAIALAMPSAIVSDVVQVDIPNKTIEYCSPFGQRTNDSLAYSK